MNDKVTMKQKILEYRLTNLEVQKYTERILSILFIAAFLFAIEGFLDEKVISMPMDLNTFYGYMKSYVFILPTFSVIALFFIYVLVKKKYISRIINYPAFTFKFDTYMIGILLSCIIYMLSVKFGFFKGKLTDGLETAGWIVYYFYFIVLLVRNRNLYIKNSKVDSENLSFLADNAIKMEGEDELERTGFVNGLVTRISSWKETESIVIGLYGEWGTGKTSVLNLMKTKFEEDKNNVIISFNPWYFKDEEQLILQFFNKFIAGIEENFSGQKSKLISNIKNYSQMITSVTLRMGVFNFSFKDFIAANKIDNDIQKLKDIIENQLEKENKKIIVYIDDLDRLDDEEIHSVFKLVKLIADFRHTTYILAFDEEIVENVLSTKYSGKKASEIGTSFLEKIIQVPLYLPPADSEDIRRIIFQGFEKVLTGNQIFLSDEELRRFNEVWSKSLGILPLTIRAAKRHQNSIVFSLPLLKDEVNIVDLFYIEGIRVFYPDVYKFIYRNAKAFLYAGKNLGFSGENTIHDEYREALKELFEKLPSTEKNIVISILKALFPRSEYLITGQNVYGGEWDKTWSVDRRICSEFYFEKYFVYSVRNGLISDVKFNSLLDELKNENVDEAVSKLKGMIIINDMVSTDALGKFLVIIDANLTLGKLEAKQSENLIYCLARIEKIIPNHFYQMFSIRSRIAITMWHLLQLQPKDGAEIVITRAMNIVESLMFCVDILRWIVPSEEVQKDFFTRDEFQRIATVVIEKIKAEIQNESFLDIYKTSSSTLLNSILRWGNNNDKTELHLKIKEWIQETNGAEKLILGFSKLISTSNIKKPTIIEFDVDSYNAIKETANPQEIADILIDKYQENSSEINIHDDKTDYEKVALEFLKLHQNIKDTQS